MRKANTTRLRRRPASSHETDGPRKENKEQRFFGPEAHSFFFQPSAVAVQRASEGKQERDEKLQRAAEEKKEEETVVQAAAEENKEERKEEKKDEKKEEKKEEEKEKLQPVAE
jgi:hypothetical protein